MSDNKEERYGFMAFTGLAGRTYFDRDGVLQTAGEDEIREEYDPLTGAYRGMLIESQDRTNIIPNQNLDTLDSSDVFGVVCEPVSDPKMGNVYRVSENSETGSHGIRFIGSLDLEDSHSGYIIVKAENSRYLTLSLRGQRVPNTYYITVDLVDGIATTDRLPSGPGEVEDIGDGWLKIHTGYYRPYAAQRSFDILMRNSENTDWEYEGEGGSFYFKGAQLEKSENSTSLIYTNGSPVTVPGEDARFTDSNVFNNFERGALLVDFKSITAQYNSWILHRSSAARFLYYHTGNLRVYDGDSAVSQPMSEDSLYIPHKYQISWDRKEVRTNVDGSKAKSMPFGGQWIGNDLIIGHRWSGYIKSLDFSPEPYSDSQARQITKRDAPTIIGECPNGGYYDYSDLSTMLIESDESGILAENRKIARVGDPVGAILDKSGHGNHLTASTDDRRGILESDGKHYWISKTGASNAIYGFSCNTERSFTAILGLSHWENKFVVLSDSDGGSGGFAMIYEESESSILNGMGLAEPRYYFDGVLKTVNNRGDSWNNLKSPMILRTLHQVTDPVRKFYLGGFTTGSRGVQGNEYGFAWGSRLSEDDALIVEQEMRQNMPAIN